MQTGGRGIAELEDLAKTIPHRLRRSSLYTREPSLLTLRTTRFKENARGLHHSMQSPLVSARRLAALPQMKNEYGIMKNEELRWICFANLLFLFVGAFCERPQANTVRPYEFVHTKQNNSSRSRRAAEQPSEKSTCHPERRMRASVVEAVGRERSEPSKRRGATATKGSRNDLCCPYKGKVTFPTRGYC